MAARYSTWVFSLLQLRGLCCWGSVLNRVWSDFTFVVPYTKTMATKMEDKDIVLQLCRDSLEHDDLERFLRGKPEEEVDLLLFSTTDGTTPLLIAALNGRNNIVKYLLGDDCDMHVNEVGTVMIEGGTHHEVTALWCAAAAGHVDVVGTLLCYGAHTDHTTETNSTALRAACFGGYLDIVKMLIDDAADVNIANQYGHTCLMLACYKGYFDIAKLLIDNGADIHSKTTKGKTALHECAEAGNLEILKMILSHGAEPDDVNSNGMTPLLVAAAFGQASIVEYLISQFLKPCKREDQINALEVLGATYMDEDHYVARYSVVDAIKYWVRAMHMRYENPACPLLKPCVRSPIAVYFNVGEVSNLTELENMSWSHDKVRMQALLILERNFPCCHNRVLSMLLLVLKELSISQDELPSVMGKSEEEVSSLLDSSFG